MKYYLYISCMGTYYMTDHELDIEDLYCEICWDYDELVGSFRTANQLRKLLKNNDTWEPYIEDIVDTWKELRSTTRTNNE